MAPEQLLLTAQQAPQERLDLVTPDDPDVWRKISRSGLARARSAEKNAEARSFLPFGEEYGFLFFPLLVLKGIYHYWKYISFCRGLKEMEVLEVKQETNQRTASCLDKTIALPGEWSSMALFWMVSLCTADSGLLKEGGQE